MKNIYSVVLEEMGNTNVLKVCLVFLFCIPSIFIYGQQQDIPIRLAHMKPMENFNSTVTEKGRKVFIDRDYVFGDLPIELQNAHFAIGSFERGVKIRPLTNGILYIVTPQKGEEYSQEFFLIEKGFERLKGEPVRLFEGQEQEFVLLRKTIATPHYANLDPIILEGWAIPFFSSQPLPSLSNDIDILWKPLDKKYELNTRLWQGISSMEKTGNRLWAAWYSGGTREPDKGNYSIIGYSDDNGKTWIDPAIIIEHRDTNVRAIDPLLWTCPDGKLWIMWVQNTGIKWFDGLFGTWAIQIDNPESSHPAWTAPRRLSDGFARNRIIILSTGEWLLPAYEWINNKSAIYISRDKGETWTFQGGPVNKSSLFYEHGIVELSDGKLWMLQRGVPHGIQQSFSTDKGKTWTELTQLPGFSLPPTLISFSRLQSGNLLIVYNDDPKNSARKNMTAVLSEDEGKTWPYKLVLDERDEVSYPNTFQDKKGRIYVTYDRSRTGEKEILFTSFTEKEIKAGKYSSCQSKQKQIISKAP